MRIINFRVRDMETKKVIGFEFFNTNFDDGYYHLDLRELKTGEEIGDLICHSSIIKADKFNQLSREEYSGFKTMDNKEIYEADIIKGRYKDAMKPVVSSCPSSFLQSINMGDVYYEDGEWFVRNNGCRLASLTDIEIIGNKYENP